MTTRPVFIQLSENFNSQEVFLEFPALFSSFIPACFMIVQCFLQDFLESDLFTESPEKKHFRI